MAILKGKWKFNKDIVLLDSLDEFVCMSCVYKCGDIDMLSDPENINLTNGIAFDKNKIIMNGTNVYFSGWDNYEYYSVIDFGNKERYASNKFYEIFTANAKPIIEETVSVMYDGKEITNIGFGQTATFNTKDTVLKGDFSISVSKESGEKLIVLSTLDESLLTSGNKGKIYKYNGNLYTIEETYVPVNEGEAGTAFFLEDGKMVTPTVPGDYSILGISINGASARDYIIRVPVDEYYNNFSPGQWWLEESIFMADYDWDSETPAGFITFPSSVTIAGLEGGDIYYENGLNVSQWARQNGKTSYKKTFVFQRIDLPMAVNVLNENYLVEENIGKIYEWNGKLWQVQNYKYGGYYFKDFMETPTETFTALYPGEYDITNYAILRVPIMSD